MLLQYRNKYLLWILLVIELSANAAAVPPRQMEKLGRGVVAVHFETGKVFVGWRIFGTDPPNIAFNLYRSTSGLRSVKLNQQPIVAASSFVDDHADPALSNSYFVRPVLNGREQTSSGPFTLPANSPVRQYLAVPLKTPEAYAPNDGSVGDLDGDGEYELVVHQVGRGRDNSQAGITTEPILEAYKLDGTMLWRINLGKNIREGAHYTQFMVYDQTATVERKSRARRLTEQSTELEKLSVMRRLIIVNLKAR